jgi:rod shape-determining protein MreD
MVVINKIYITATLLLLFAIILNILPLPNIIDSCRPPILLLFLIYCSLAYPDNINLTYAFISGLILDILLIMPLGYNALCFTVTIYLIMLYYPQIRLQSNWNKMFSLLLILIPYFLSSTFINSILKIDYSIVNVIISIVLSVIIWPSLFNMLRFIRQKYTQ